MQPQVHDDAGSDKFFLAWVGELEDLYREVFFLAYHLHWAHEEIMNLDLLQRRTYLRMLSDAIEQQNAEMRRTTRGIPR